MMNNTAHTAPEQHREIEMQQMISAAYLTYFPSIVSYVSYKTNHHPESEDMAQDVFVRLMDYKQLVREQTIKSFIFTIARNIVVDFQRRHNRRTEISANMAEFSETSTGSHDEYLHAKEIRQMEKQFLVTFPRQRKMVYILSRYGDQPVDEIAQRLQISKRTAENHLFQGRQHMRNYLRKCI